MTLVCGWPWRWRACAAVVHASLAAVLAEDSSTCSQGADGESCQAARQEATGASAGQRFLALVKEVKQLDAQATQAREAGDEWRSQAIFLEVLNVSRSIQKLVESADVLDDMKEDTDKALLDIYLRKLKWSTLLELPKRELAAAASTLAAHLGSKSSLKRCCEDQRCGMWQVRLLELWAEIGSKQSMKEAKKHVKRFRRHLPQGGHCMGNRWLDSRRPFVLQVAPHEKGIMTLPEAAMVDPMNSPAFWSVSDVPLAALLEEHAAELLSELKALTEPTLRMAMAFKTEQLSDGLATKVMMA
eukprot:TRINITY_DN18195_c0_g1_i4.p1 TRINITY_DN18195_c0_g1~~TRINITY_DN18195_c0_g1_i4.p1  ORF type:complete len:300 (-),score=88.86 TRINITY_DN18195_c0_g1_i4:374-1273(-)